MQVTIHIPDEYRDRVLSKMTGPEWKAWLLDTIHSKIFDNEQAARQKAVVKELDADIKKIGITVT